MSAPVPSPARRAISRELTLGGLVIAVLVLGLGGWAATAGLAGAVVAQGTLVVDSSVKKVQHLDGGIVAEILVRDGDRVAASQILVRLDPTAARAELQIILARLDELAARQARLQAELVGAAAIAFPASLLARSFEPGVAAIKAAEIALFESRRTALAGQQAQLAERIAQFEQEAAGYADQLAARQREAAIVAGELIRVQGLEQIGLATRTQVTDLSRLAAQLDGQAAELAAIIAQTQGRAAEARLQLLQLDYDRQAEAGAGLTAIRADIAELAERRIAAEDKLARTDIAAPQAGIVHQLAVHTVGGVVQPGEALMLIVPESDTLLVEARVSPREIDRLYPGQPVVIRLASFNARTTPELNGELVFIAADLTEDARTGARFYLVRVAVPPAEVARLGADILLPGMPVEVFIRTDERTVLSYLTKPLFDEFAAAFRER